MFVALINFKLQTNKIFIVQTKGEIKNFVAEFIGDIGIG